MFNQKTKLLISFIVGLFCVFLTPQSLSAQYSFNNEPLIKIINEIEESSEYRFLYRESQIQKIRMSFESSSDKVLDQLQQKLSLFGIQLQADSERMQVVLFRNESSSSPSNKLQVSGQVVDANSGERLPYATIYWENEGAISGLSSNAYGNFTLHTDITSDVFNFIISYVGYKPEEVSLQINRLQNFSDLTVRLQPITFINQELIVLSNQISGINGSINKDFIENGLLNTFGESNTTRSLQVLPSVSKSVAINNGINVRGSSSDATMILLDGISIYNQSHLFGLLDSFNPNALQTSAFYYDITPAQFQSRPGGTLSMTTKSGSLNEFNMSLGLSNSSVNSTFQGPIKRGQSSWFLSGRTSYLNAVNWFQNKSLVAYGLNVNRPTEVLSNDVTDLNSQLITPGDYKANFYDLHGKLKFEFQNSSRLQSSFYFGGDVVSQDAERLVRRFNPDNPGQRFDLQTVETKNNWGNASFSNQFNIPLSNNTFSTSLLALSVYETDFSKDDFVYNLVNPNQGSIQVFTFPLQNRSVFNEFKASQTFDFLSNNSNFSFGTSYQYFYGEYFEQSFDRPAFLTKFESSLFDVFGAFENTNLDWIHLNSGARMHYYTNGKYLYLSPRLKADFLPRQRIRFNAGYSKDFQFNHRLSFYNISSPDVWILSTAEQPPTKSDSYSVGFQVDISSSISFQTEAYYKSLENVRFFEINANTLTSTFDSAPWLYNNDGISQGLEFLISWQSSKVKINSSYTLSDSEFSNPAIRNGRLFKAEWNRKHSFATFVQFQISRNVRLFGNVTLSSGTPNRLYFLGLESEENLSNYQRVDTGIEYLRTFGDRQFEFNFSIYNLLDKNNTWYRELNLVIDNSVEQNRRVISSRPVDVYDLGIQPSFNATVWF